MEDMVRKLYAGKTIADIDTKNLGFKARHKTYHTLSSKALDQNADVIYQAGFATDKLFVKTDFLVKNEL
ncbi:TPA: hypothetical protein DCZ39_07040 [Patescibacteria group bacterium]|nr:hypothetical protein [Candidatus Gracilibacteria bacterium]